MRRRLSILIYHRVLERPDPLQPSLPVAGQFERHMRWLGRLFNVLPLDEAVRRLREDTLPARAAAITFDDGYADNYEVALPILRRLGLPATFFIASGYLGGGRMWNDTVIEAVRHWPTETLSLDCGGVQRHPMRTTAERRRALDSVLPALKHRPFDERALLVEELTREARLDTRSTLMMNVDQVRTMHREGMGIGGHTRWHPILKVLPDNQARFEIESGRDDLQAIIDGPVPLFAYPNGRPNLDFDARHVRMVRDAGFSAAVTTEWAAGSSAADAYMLPRFTPWDRATTRFLARLAHYRRPESRQHGAAA